MKTSKFFLSTLVAAAAMTSTAFAESANYKGDTLLINFATGKGVGDTSWGTWNETSGEKGSASVLFNSLGKELSDSALSYSSKNVYGWGDSTLGMLAGYLDDGEGVSITVETPFLVADVTIYCATDTEDRAFTAKQINGVYYTHSDGKTKQGDAAWGQSRSSKVIEGTNALTVSEVSSRYISISSLGSNTGPRGCIAGLKIVETSVQKTFTFAGEDGLTWTSTQLGATENSWVNASAINGWTYADITLSKDTAVSVEEDVSAVAIFTSGSGALTFNGTGSIDMPLLGTISAGDGTSIVFNNTLNFANGGTISGSVSFGVDATVNVNGGTLSVEEGTVLATGNINLAKAATIYISESLGDAFNLSSIKGDGTIAVNAKGNTANGDGFSWVTLSNEFTGTLSITSGVVDLLTVRETNNSAVDTSRLGGASVINLNGGGILLRNTTGTLSKDITVGPNGGAIRLYGAGNATISGTVTGDGALTHTDGGTLTFTNTVDIGTFNQIGGNDAGNYPANTNFQGQTTIDTVNVSGATITFSGTNAITTLNATGGTTNISGSGTISTVNLGHATLSGDGNTKIETLRFGHGDGETESFINDKISATNVFQATSGQVDGEKLILREGAELVVSETFGTNNTNADDSSQVRFVLNIGKNATLATKLLSHGNDLDISLGEGAKVSADSLVLNAVWGDKQHTFTGGEDYPSTLSFGGVSLHGNATLHVSNSRLEVGTNGISGSNETTLNLDNVTLAVREGADSWSASGVAMSLTNTATADVEGEKSITIESSLSGSGNLTKDGAGTLTLSGANTYEGGTTISEGILAVANNSALGVWKTTEDETQTTYYGEVTVSGGQLSIGEGVTIENDIGIILSDAYETSAAIIGAGTLDGKVEVSVADLDALGMLASSYKLWEGITLSENVKVTIEGLDTTVWSFDVADGLLTFSAIPEPSAFGLLAGIGALALVAARRRRRQ